MDAARHSSQDIHMLSRLQWAFETATELFNLDRVDHLLSNIPGDILFVNSLHFVQYGSPPFVSLHFLVLAMIKTTK